jgi:hypothetical protein
MKHQKIDEIKNDVSFRKEACQYLNRGSLDRSSRGATNWLLICWDQCFFFGSNFAKFQLQKCDFNLYKGLLMKKNDPNPPNYEWEKISNCYILMMSSSR